MQTDRMSIPLFDHFVFDISLWMMCVYTERSICISFNMFFELILYFSCEFLILQLFNAILLLFLSFLTDRCVCVCVVIECAFLCVWAVE